MSRTHLSDGPSGPDHLMWDLGDVHDDLSVLGAALRDSSRDSVMDCLSRATSLTSAGTGGPAVFSGALGTVTHTVPSRQWWVLTTGAVSPDRVDLHWK